MIPFVFNSCIAIPGDETCLPQLPYSFYAPNTFDLTNKLFREIQIILGELDPFNDCRRFINSVVCVLRFPACNATSGRILPICPDLCSFIDGVIIARCSSEFFANNPNFSAVNDLLNRFECLQPQSYYNFPAQYIENASVECSNFCKYRVLLQV